MSNETVNVTELNRRL